MIGYLVLVTGLLPNSRWKVVALRLLGWTIAPNVRLQPAIFWRLKRVTLATNTRIGFGCVFRGLDSLTLAESAGLGQWNWISASPVFPAAGRYLELGRHSAVTSRHYIDCSGGVSIGEFTTVAGVRSTLITHGIDVVTSQQIANGISIGNYCLVGSNACFTPGASVKDRVQIAMGALVHGELASDRLYAGVPARALRLVSGVYFERETGHVD